jgi:dienelactone hydrolase
MNKKIFRTAFWALWGLFSLVSRGAGSMNGGASTSDRIWPDLNPGPYAVGYQLKQTYDHSRTFKRKTDYFGRRAEGEISRPLQISIWYPAKPLPGAASIKVEEYFQTRVTETDFRPPASEQIQKSIAELKELMMMEWRVPPERQAEVEAKLNGIFDSPAFAVKEAPAESGPFPLIIHMPGYNGSPTGYPMFEYLASRGYVVAAVPNMGAEKREIDDERLSLEVQARDMDFVLASMREFPFVDPENVGTTGMSWGGMSNILFAERNSRVGAVVTLDGAITMPEELKLIESLPGYAHKKFRASYLQLMTAPEAAKFRPKDTRFYESLKYANAYMIQFTGVDHGEYSVDLLRLRNSSETDPARIAYLEGFARTIMRYTAEFFDAFLKGKSEARAFLDNPPETNGVPPGLIQRTASKAAHPAPPNRDDFARLVREQGIAAAAKVFQDAEVVDPDLASLMTSSLLGPLFMAAFEAGKNEEALEICRFWARRIPQEPGPFFSMARIYRKTGQTDEAVRCYEKILELVPEGRTAESARKALEELKKKRTR